MSCDVCAYYIMLIIHIRLGGVQVALFLHSYTSSCKIAYGVFGIKNQLIRSVPPSLGTTFSVKRGLETRLPPPPPSQGNEVELISSQAPHFVFEYWIHVVIFLFSGPLSGGDNHHCLVWEQD